MKPILKSLKNRTDPDKLISGTLLVICLGDGARSSHISDLHHTKAAACWCLAESIDHAAGTIIADQLPQDINIDVTRANQFHEKLANWLLRNSTQPNGTPHIVVDVSCMSRRLMAEVFEAIFQISTTREISVGVIYTLAKFSHPDNTLPINKDICPVSQRFSGWPSSSELPTSLVVGLGYEKEKAEGACEYFDPSEILIFSPKSPIPEYDEEVHKNNSDLITRVSARQNYMRYKLDDPAQTFGELVTAVSSLISRSNPVLLPFGPKLFFAISLFVSLVFEEVGVWIVTGDLSPPMPSEPSQHLLAFEATLSPCTEPA